MGSSLSYAKFGKQTAIYALGVLLSRAASFLMLPIYTRFLDPSEYGTLELLDMSVNVISMLASVAISASFFKFYSDYKDPKSKNLVVSTSCCLITFLSVIALTICWFLSKEIALLTLGDIGYSHFLHIVLITFVLQSFIEIPMLYLRAEGKAELFVFYDFVKLILQISLCIYFIVFLKKGVLGVLYANLIAHFALSVMLVYPIRNIPFKLSLNLGSRILIFGAPLIFNALGHFTLTFSDRYFISALRDLNDVGIYSLAYKFGFLLSIMVYYPFSQVWEAKRFDVAKTGAYQKHFYHTFFFLNIFVYICAFLICLFSREVILVMSAPSFHSAYRIIPIIVIAYLFQIWTSFCNIGLYIKHKTAYLGSATAFCAILVLPLNFYLIEQYGAYGAAYATVAIFFIRFVLVYNFSQRFFYLKYGWRRIILLAGLGIGLYLLVTYIITANIILTVFFKCLATVIFLAFALVILPDKEEKGIITDLISGLKRKLVITHFARK